MEVTVASVKNKGAGDGPWQKLKGSVKGLAANLLIDPLTVEAIGHRAMLDFGGALISGAATFTFPRATNLNSNSSTGTNVVPSRTRFAPVERGSDEMIHGPRLVRTEKD